MSVTALPDIVEIASTRFSATWLDDPDFSPSMLYKSIGYVLVNFPNDAEFMVSRNAPPGAPHAEIWLAKQAIALGCSAGCFFAVIADGDRRIDFDWQGNNWLEYQVDRWGELCGLSRKLSLRMQNASFAPGQLEKTSSNR